MPTQFAVELKKEGLIKNLYETNQLKSLIKRENESIRSARKIICPSDFIKKYLVSKLNIDDSFVSICPFGVDLEFLLH